ncbi:MAG: SCO family protein [Acidobacteriota bacterium]|nr:SCO family protein [Acidobacteriota bacterium]
MRYFFLFLFSVFLFTACQKVDAPAQNASVEAKHFPFKGTVVSVDKAKKTATIKHDAIPGYMDAMTMAFPIKDDWVWEDLSPGADIRADLVVDKDSFWLEKIGISALPDPNQTPLPVREDVAQIGNQVPDFTLTNQDGKRISMKDFRGKALAITFIYSRCPLPNYCILMSKNFSDMANQLNDNADLKDKIRLLSISFDPKTDTPAKLKEYGRGYLGKNSPTDFTVWQLATGTDKEVKSIADFFGLRYQTDQNDQTQFNHSLRTIVVTPDGKVRKVFSGNDWTIAELSEELQATL